MQFDTASQDNNKYIEWRNEHMVNHHLHVELYKAIVAFKSDLEAEWANGMRGEDYDLPIMAAGCEYSGIEKFGFSGKLGKKKRSDIKPFLRPLLDELKNRCPKGKNPPHIVYKRKRIDKHFEYTTVVKRYVGTCAEDKAANLILWEMKNSPNKPTDLKHLVFAHPVRTRTLKREKMCDVCRDLFTEP